jgi:hypothetical protein
MYVLLARDGRDVGDCRHPPNEEERRDDHPDS